MWRQVGGYGDFSNEDVEVIFNRDMLINEGEIINNVNKSTDLSLETRLANHPWIDDVDAELERINKQKENELNEYMGAFPGSPPSARGDPNKDGDINEE